MFPPEVFNKRIESRQIVLGCNNWIIQYTDGVNEAKNLDQEEFGLARFQSILRSCRQLSPQDLVKETLRRHREFVGSAPQYDDITLLAMKWKGLTAENNINRSSENTYAYQD